MDDDEVKDKNIDGSMLWCNVLSCATKYVCTCRASVQSCLMIIKRLIIHLNLM